MKRIACLVTTASLVLSSCATILNSSTQKNIVNTSKGDKDAKVFINEEPLSYNTEGKISLKKDNQVKQVKIVKEGYKDTYKVVFQNKKSVNYLLSKYLFHLPTLTYSSIIDRNSVKSNDFPKEVSFTSSNIKIPSRKDSQKFLVLKNTEFDVSKDNFHMKIMLYRNYVKGRNKFYENQEGKEDLKFGNSIFTDSIKNILDEYNFKDKDNKIFTDNLNTLKVSCIVNDVEILGVKQPLGSNSKTTGYNTITIYEIASFFYNTKLNVKWLLTDAYDNEIFEKSMESRSGDFSSDFYEDKTIKMATNDALLKSFYQFISEVENKGFLKKEKAEIGFNEKIKIQNISDDLSVADLLNATVTIKTGEESHGSGCVISNNGYIVTNLHVAANTDILEVIDNEGNTYKAKLIRSSKLHDLALLKVDATFKNHYALPTEKKYQMGDDILVIGTPTNIALGQTISKGIISGLRKASFAKFIQTDASINSGNSGGAMVSKSTNQLVGIINSKFFGLGIEGIGFAIPAEIIIESLGLEISK